VTEQRSRFDVLASFDVTASSVDFTSDDIKYEDDYKKKREEEEGEVMALVQDRNLLDQGAEQTRVLYPHRSSEDGSKTNLIKKTLRR
jgi:hypothetical protein